MNIDVSKNGGAAGIRQICSHRVRDCRNVTSSAALQRATVLSGRFRQAPARGDEVGFRVVSLRFSLTLDSFSRSLLLQEGVSKASKVTWTFSTPQTQDLSYRLLVIEFVNLTTNEVCVPVHCICAPTM